MPVNDERGGGEIHRLVTKVANDFRKDANSKLGFINIMIQKIDTGLSLSPNIAYTCYAYRVLSINRHPNAESRAHSESAIHRN